MCGISTVWNKVYRTPIMLEETHNNGVDRTALTLPTGGNEQDVNAMLDLYEGSVEISDQKTDQKTGENQPENVKTDQKAGGNRPENTKTDQKKQILDLILENPSISRLELAKRLGLHDSTVNRRMESLVADGYIKRIGSYKGGYWEVIKPMS